MSPHRVTRERVHIIPKNIWDQRSFRDHLRSLNCSQDMHYWLLHNIHFYIACKCIEFKG